MALTQVIQNVYTFANVLLQSGTRVVEHWDDKSLQNAFNWARYCVKIEEETRNKGYREELDQHIQSLTVLLRPVTLLDLSLDTLKGSLILLCKRLLQNPACPAEMRNAVGNLPTLTEEEMSVVLTCCGSHDDRAKAGPCLYLLLGEDQQFESLSIKSQGQRTIDRLVKLYRLSTVSRNRFERFLMKLTAEVLSCPSTGWGVLCGVLHAEVTEPDCHDGVEYIKGVILQTISSSHIDILLWQSDQKTLCELSSRDDRFRDLHLDLLLAVADDMEPVYGYTDTGDLYTWRCRGDAPKIQGIDTSFSGLLGHLSKFLLFDKRLKDRLVTILKERGEQSYFNVWKDILKTLQA